MSDPNSSPKIVKKGANRFSGRKVSSKGYFDVGDEC